MSFGSTSGRGFESEFAPYVYGAILVITVLLWLVFEYDNRKRDKDSNSETERDD